MKKTFTVTIEIADDPAQVCNASYLGSEIYSIFDGLDDVRYNPIAIEVRGETNEG
jgi:hypothetical protein